MQQTTLEGATVELLESLYGAFARSKSCVGDTLWRLRGRVDGDVNLLDLTKGLQQGAQILLSDGKGEVANEEASRFEEKSVVGVGVLW